MKKFMPLFIVLAILLLIGGYVTAQYNGFVNADAAVENAWADVEAQYQRRADLIPNLVSTVRGAADFEQETFTDVTEARSAWAQARQVGDREDVINAASGLDGALSRLLVTVENYPQLQATQAFSDLMTQLEGTENRITTARRDYNGTATAYNARVRRFPGRLFAAMFGFDEEPLFAASEGSDEAPSVEF